MKVLIACRYTGLGNRIQFLPVLHDLLFKDDKQVYCDDNIYDYLGYKNIRNIYRYPVKPDLVLVPFGYNWKKFWRLRLKYPFSKFKGYKYRILGRHIGFGYSESVRFNENENEVLQNTKFFTKKSNTFYPSYPGIFHEANNFLNKNQWGKCVLIHNTEKASKKIPVDVLMEICLRLSNKGWSVYVVGHDEKEISAWYVGTEWFETLIKVVSKCSYYIGPDTGVMHLADSLYLKSLVLFGPTDNIKNSPQNGVTMTLNLYCRPCYDWGRIKCHRVPKYQCNNFNAEKIYDKFMRNVVANKDLV